MDNYHVKALISFTDYYGKEITPTNPHEERKAGVSEWWCTAERYQFLKDNGAVELIEIKKEEKPKKETKKKK